MYYFMITYFETEEKWGIHNEKDKISTNTLDDSTYCCGIFNALGYRTDCANKLFSDP